MGYSLAASAYLSYILPTLTETKLEITSTLIIRNVRVAEIPIKRIDLASCARVSLWLFNSLWFFSSIVMVLMCIDCTKNYIDTLNTDIYWWIANLMATLIALRAFSIWTNRVLPNSR